MAQVIKVDNINERYKNGGGRTQLTKDYSQTNVFLDTMKARLRTKGGTDQWVRMRQDKLKGLRRALYYSYQSAIVQPYDTENVFLIKNIIAIISILQLYNEQLNPISENQLKLLLDLEAEDSVLATTAATAGRYTFQYVSLLNKKIEQYQKPYFRALLNHDKLKVDYEDKIISIPFEQNSVSIDPVKDNNDWLQTNFHNGTVFKWVHGNKEEWVPDTYWIVYMQYSQETAYFRGEIRRADDEITIVVIDEEGKETERTYRGWTTGPNEQKALWNVKKGVVWNDLNYTKLLFITKDKNTLAQFKRFDKIRVNGEYWEVLAYNENFGNSHGQDTGIIRVALGESYTPTNQMIERLEQKQIQERNKQQEKDNKDELEGNSYIDGPEVVYPFDSVTYRAKNLPISQWQISNNNLARITSISQDGTEATIRITSLKSNKEGFDIIYGENFLHIIIKPI